jgi:hypothetical protein
VEHFVPIQRWPEGLDFPADLRERIQYDPTRGRLVYRGFMSKSEFDRLCKLSDDWSYRRPLEDLFRLCTVEPSRPNVFGRVLTALGVF